MDNKNTNHVTELEQKSQAKSQKSEKVMITVSAVFVMAALTLTGIYMNNKKEQDKTILEESSGLDGSFEGNLVDSGMEIPGIDDVGDLQIVDSGTVENPGRTGIAGTMEGTESEGTDNKKPATKSSNDLVGEESAKNPENKAEDSEKTTEGSEDLSAEEVLSGTVEAMMLSFNGIQMFAPFTESEKVLIPYSMDKAVYFKTLDQYKYNPAMIIAAEVHTPVCAVAAGKVVDIYWDHETGWTMEMDLGGGFKAYYGQLNSNAFAKSVDTYVAAGDILSYVAEPTKYFTEEGSCLYFAMTRDGHPVDPAEYVTQ